MPSIYIAYSHADKEYVTKLERLLTASEFDVYIDSKLEPGEVWAEQLPKLLAIADAFVVVISPNSIQSSWVMSEVGAALGLFRERSKPIILPVVLDETELPEPLGRIQAVFASRTELPQTAAHIVRAVKRALTQSEIQRSERLEIEKRVKSSAETYINNSLLEMKAKERTYFRLAWMAYLASILILAVSAIVFALNGIPAIFGKTSSWFDVAGGITRTLLIVGFLSALIRVAFSLGKSFMVESLRYSDRVHAISFGEFYLNGFGGSDWNEVKDAFQNWNLDRGSNFTLQEVRDVDPQILSTVLELGKAIATKSTEKKGKSGSE